MAWSESQPNTAVWLMKCTWEIIEFFYRSFVILLLNSQQKNKNVCPQCSQPRRFKLKLKISEFGWSERHLHRNRLRFTTQIRSAIVFLMETIMTCVLFIFFASLSTVQSSKYNSIELNIANASYISIFETDFSFSSLLIFSFRSAFGHD